MPFPESRCVMRFPLKVSVALAVALALGGCASLIQSEYRRPALDVPNDWQQQVAQAEQAQQADWWQAFADPELNRLVELALQRNNDLGTALLNLRKAYLQEGLAREARWPQLSASGSGERSRVLSGGASTAHAYSFDASASWEADLWNRLGSNVDAAQLEAQATEQDYAATRLSLVGSVATLYWQIAYLNERLALSAASIDYARQTLALVQVQYDAGQASALELAEADQSLQSQLASDVELRQQQVEQRNALAILFDSAQLPTMQELQGLMASRVPSVDAGLPAQLLANRPDLQAAELRLRSQLKSVDATRASYYPDLSLTGALGYSSAALGSLLQNPVATLGAGVSLPFLQYQQMQLDIDVSQTEYELAVVDFRQTLYAALSDVENNLAARRHYAEQQVLRERALASAREAERIYRVRYQVGAETLQSWLAAQETRRSAEVSLAENRLNQLLNYIDLCQALGGPAQPQQAGGLAQ